MQLALGLLLLHLTLGLIFFAHGAQKLFGLFGGQGLQGTTKFFEMLGLYPAQWWAIAAALGETLSGLLMALGLFTPLAALLIAAVMLVAFLRVHMQHGFWNSKGGYEYNLVLFVLALALAITGAGRFSLDALIGLGPVTMALFLPGVLFLVILGLLVWPPTVSWVQKHWHVFQS
jgi:putative oxidoreductase